MKCLVSVACASYLVIPTALADFTDRFNLSGFATLGLSHLNEKGPEYRIGRAADGATNEGTFLLDTRLGLQLDAQISDRLSATVQGLVRDDEEGLFTPELEWAFLRGYISDSWSMRAGIMALPAFSLSDYREVGYANNLFRPPEDIYAQIPLRKITGIDLIGEFDIGDSSIMLQAFAGNSRESVQNSAIVDASNVVGINVSLNRGFSRFRLSHLQSDLSIESGAQSDQISELEQAAVIFPLIAPVVEDLAGGRGLMTITGLLAGFDFERLFLNAEYTQFRNESYVANTDGWYISAGYRLGSFTPYAFHSALKNKRVRPDFQVPDIPQTERLLSVLDFVYADPTQQTTGLGVRWDFLPALALKIQLEHISRKELGVSFSRVVGNNPGEAGQDVKLFSVGVDIIF